MPRSSAPARARRQAADKTPAASAAAPSRKASRRQAVASAPPAAEVAEAAPTVKRARSRTRAQEPVAIQAQAVAAPPPAPRRGRRRTSTAEVLDALDQGFVPKAPPPNAPAHAKPFDAAGHEASGSMPDAGPAGSRVSPHAAPRLSTTEPAVPVRHDPPGGLALALAPPLTSSTPVRQRCPSCDYPLARQARFCRRCGVAQRPTATAPLIGAAQAGQANSAWADAARPSAAAAPSDEGVAPGVAQSMAFNHAGDAQTAAAESTRAESEITSSAHTLEQPRFACIACGMVLPGSTRFCRFCGERQAGSPGNPAAPEDGLAVVETVASVEAKTLIIQGAPESGLAPEVVTEPEAAGVPEGPAVTEAAESPAAEFSVTPPETASGIDCHACGEHLPAIARFCMFCAAPQGLAHEETPAPSPPDSSPAEVEKAESAMGDVSAAHEAPNPEQARDSVQNEAAAAPPMDAAPPDTVPPDAPPAQEPLEEPAPVPAITLLEPDVVERLARARDDIDEIGRSIDSLARTLTASSAQAQRPSALPPRRR